MRLNISLPQDFNIVQSLYWDIIEAMKNSPFSPKWERGIYPTDASLSTFIEKKQMYLVQEDVMTMGAMVLNDEWSHGYEQARWQSDASDFEIAVIHLLGVHPSCTGRGVAKFLVTEARRIAMQQKKKAIRLDVLENNVPAQRLYESMGFLYCDTIQLFYEDTGSMDFKLYEYIL